MDIRHLVRNRLRISLSEVEVFSVRRPCREGLEDFLCHETWVSHDFARTGVIYYKVGCAVINLDRLLAMYEENLLGAVG